MTAPTTYEIVINGRASAHFLRPLLDDFTVESVGGATRLLGEIRDAAHLHGIIAHLTSVNAELISITRRASALPATALSPTYNGTSHNP